MPRPPAHYPTNGELPILQLLWERGPMTVRDVHTALERRPQPSYTTVLKTMQIMHHKGLLKRNEDQRSHIYHAAVSKRRTQSSIIRHVLENAFEGSLSQLLLGALQNKAATPEEMRKIQRILEEHQP